MRHSIFYIRCLEEDCGCDPRGSVNNSCDPFTRQCFCKVSATI